MTNLKWALVGIPIALLVLGTAGISVTRVLPFAFLVLCPLIMMGMHGSSSHRDQER